MTANGHGSAGGKLFLFRVSVWPYRIDAGGRQVCDLRGVCGVCGWLGKIRTTDRVAKPNESPEGIQAAQEMLRHARNAHAETYRRWKAEKGVDR